MPKFSPHWYLKTYLLARDGKTDREIAKELDLSWEDFEDFVLFRPPLRAALDRGRVERDLNRPIGMRSEERLTEKQQKFVHEYLKDFNGVRAAKAAGYSQRSAAEIASENLMKPQIIESIQNAMAKQAQDVGVKPEWVVREMARMANPDLRKCFDEDGNLLLPHQWPDDVAACLAGVDVVTVTKGRGEDQRVEYVHKIKQWPKDKALDMLARHFGLYRDKLELSGPEGGPLLLQAVTDLEANRKQGNVVDAETVRRRALEHAQQSSLEETEQ